MMMSPAKQWWYELDGVDRVTAVCNEWDAFALENDGSSSLAAAVVGRSLWDFVAGRETAHLLGRIMRAVRTTGRPVETPFRCDGPGVERHMLFRATALESGCLRITTRLVREAPLDPAAPPAGAAPELGELISMCSWCNRIRVQDGWAEVAEAVARLALFSSAAMPAITHGMCSECLAAMEPLLEDEPASAPAPCEV
jgi:hypothetical protein